MSVTVPLLVAHAHKAATGTERTLWRYMVSAPAPPTASPLIHVVFVHGLFSGKDVWRQFARLLAEDPDLHVEPEYFVYDSPFAARRPDRTVPDPNDLGDQLRAFLDVRYTGDHAVVLVTHSQGGLIAQRYLSRSLREGRGHTLAPLRGVVMYACPNAGSDFFGILRRMLGVFWKNAQVRQLEVFCRDVMETERHIATHVVNASENGNWQWRLPVYSYGAASDRVVRARVARGNFTDGAVLPGDHFSVVRPDNRSHESYRVLKRHLLEVARTLSARTAPAPPVDRVPVVVSPPPAREPASVSARPPTGTVRTKLHGSECHEIIGTVLSPSADRPRIHVLTGIGGSGKTRVAVEIALRAMKDRRVWWISATQVNPSMREVAAQLEIPSGEAASAFGGLGSSIDLVWRYLDRVTEPWMLVFDNVDSPNWLGSGGGGLADGNGWIREPATPHGTVVVTSRDLRADIWLPPCVVHQVHPLSRNAGATLLLECAPHGGSVEDARQLSAELGGLPLALKQAAASVEAVRSDVPVVWQPEVSDFRTYRAALKRRMGSPPGTDRSRIAGMFDQSIMQQVCGIALDQLSERGLPQAAPLLKVFACLNVAPIPYRLLLKSPSVPLSPLLPDFTRAQCQAVLAELDHRGLIEDVPLTETDNYDLKRGFTLHPVVQGLLRGDEDVQRRMVDYYALALRMLLDVAKEAPPDAPEHWKVWAALMPHAVDVAKQTAEAGVRDLDLVSMALELARLAARFLIVGGLLRPADDLLAWLIGHCEEYGFAPDDREIMGLRHEKGRIALEMDDHGRAERDLRQVVADRARVLGPAHSDTLASRHKFARSILEQDRWAEAEKLLTEVVEAEYREHGVRHSDTITVRHSLARAQMAMDRRAQAEDTLREILRVSQEILSPGTPETLRIRQTLARCLLETGRVPDALAEIRRALRDVPHGRADVPLTMSLRFTLCQALLLHGDIQEAGVEATRLREDRELALGIEHPETVRTMKLLADIHGIPEEPG